MEVSATGVSTEPSGQNAAVQSLTQNFDTFLTLLTTQLQNQDPLSPMDSSDFTNQIVQFSALEQQITQTSRLDKLLALQESGQALAAVGYLGKAIEAAGDIAILADGEATIGYELPAGAAKATITIFDSSGAPLRALTAAAGSGRQSVVWDGTDEQGIVQSDGVYAAVVTAADQAGGTLPGGTLFFTGVATEVSTIDGTTFVKIGDQAVAIGEIRAVRPVVEKPAA